MATYNLTVTTNAKQEKGLNFVLAQINTPRLAMIPPLSAITTQEYLQSELNRTIAESLQQYKNDLRDRIDAVLQTAPAGTVTQVAEALGIVE